LSDSCGIGLGFGGCGKTEKFCHSERSEESLLDLSLRKQKKERFLASLGMTELWVFPPAVQADILYLFV
jgi:hypothetical protein